MQKFLLNKSIFFHWQSWLLLCLFFVIRIISFFLYGHLLIQGMLVFTLLMFLGILYFKNPIWAWFLVLGEIFIGGSGYYLQLADLPIRVLFVFFFLFLWVAHHFGQKLLGQKMKINNYFNILLTILFIFLATAFFNGLAHGNNLTLITKDLMPFCILLLIFPSNHLFESQDSQNYLIRLIIVFLIGTAITSLLMFILLTVNLLPAGTQLYHWYTEINLGGIIPLPHHFFRVVEPGHLLIVPLILMIGSLLMRNEKHHKMWRFLLIVASLILVINLVRGYLFALAIGLLVLKYKHTWKRWLKVSITTISIITVLFVGINFFTSQFSSLGLDLLNIRIDSIWKPQIEIITNTRMSKLPVLLEMIKTSPIFGIGLGTTIDFINPITFEDTRTTQYEWGYFENWIKLGFLGTLNLILIYVSVIYLLIKKVQTINDYHDFDVGLIAGLTALLIANITISAISSVYGIFFLLLAMAITVKSTSIFERTTALLYQIFNRLREINKKEEPAA